LPHARFYIIGESDHKKILVAYDAMVTAKWAMEGWVATQPNAPALNLPKNGVARPYAVLDYMAALNQIPFETIGNGWKFSAAQRNNILIVNRVLYGGGWIKSDSQNDTYETLSIDGGDYTAEVDHIVPRKGQNGCNAYSNAQVVSWLKNKQKGMTS
jgi:hypothetical protein